MECLYIEAKLLRNKQKVNHKSHALLLIRSIGVWKLENFPT